MRASAAYGEANKKEEVDGGLSRREFEDVS